MEQTSQLLNEVERLIDASAYGNAASQLDYIKQLPPLADTRENARIVQRVEELERRLD